jgi:hypothetical protein
LGETAAPSFIDGVMLAADSFRYRHDATAVFSTAFRERLHPDFPIVR